MSFLRGIEQAVWPARLQRLNNGPLVDLLTQSAWEGAELWLDGGHNPHAAQAIATTMSSFEERAGARLFLIVGMQDNKDARGYFDAFEGLASGVFAVAADKEFAADPVEIAEAARASGLPADPCDNLEDALRRAINTAEKGERLRIIICGSLYLAGDVLKENS